MIVLLSRNLTDPLPPDPTRPFDTGGAVLSAIGLVLVVTGILAADNNVWLMLILIVAGALVLALFFRSVRAKEKAGKEPLLSTSLFRNRTSNLGLVTQNTQWLMLMGTSFVVSAYLQVVRGYNAIQTGVIFTAATLGILVSSLAAERLAKRRAQRTLILAGFVVTIAGIAHPAPPGHRISNSLGVRTRPTPDWPRSRRDADAIGQHRAVEFLGRSAGRDLGPVPQRVQSRLDCLGTAIAGTILVAGITVTPERSYGLAMAVLAVVGLVGLVAAVMLPSQIQPVTVQDVAAARIVTQTHPARVKPGGHIAGIVGSVR